MSSTLRPRGDRVIIERQKINEKSTGGIILPQTATQDRPAMGTVVAVGPGRVTDQGTLIPIDLEPGDEVFFSKYAGTDIKIDDETELLVLSENEIMVVLAATPETSTED